MARNIPVKNDHYLTCFWVHSTQPWARSLDVSAVSKISSRVESRVESRLALRKSSSSTRIFEAYLTRSLVELSQVLLDFTRLVPYTRLVEGMDTLSSRDTRASSSFKVLELEKNEYRVWHSRKNSPMAATDDVKNTPVFTSL